MQKKEIHKEIFFSLLGRSWKKSGIFKLQLTLELQFLSISFALLPDLVLFLGPPSCNSKLWWYYFQSLWAWHFANLPLQHSLTCTLSGTLGMYIEERRGCRNNVLMHFFVFYSIETVSKTL
jgi:hypothetical protein